jgi:lysophospholipase L1-like esterase
LEQAMTVKARTAPAGARRKGRIARFGAPIGLQLLLLLAMLAAAEGVLRIVDLRELRDGYTAGASLVHRYDPDLGWSPVANVTTTFTGSRTIAVRNNSFGLRDIEHDRTAKPTVLFLGDSFVWGYDVEQNERFTELLRDELVGTRIVNAGVVGYGTDQEYLLLDRIWNAFQPAVVVLMFCVNNDRADNSVNLNDGGYYKPYLKRDAGGAWRFAGRPVPKSRHSYFIDDPLVRNLWLARAAVTGYVRLRRPKITVPDPTERLVAMMRELVEAKGARFLVGLQRREAQLAAFLQTQNIPYTAFDAAESYATDGSHWTPKGHRLVADRIRSLLAATAAPAPTGSLQMPGAGECEHGRAPRAGERGIHTCANRDLPLSPEKH